LSMSCDIWHKRHRYDEWTNAYTHKTDSEKKNSKSHLGLWITKITHTNVKISPMIFVVRYEERT
jgi:hypothetical protein